MSPSRNRMEVYVGSDGQHRWRHKAANNEITATSEGYPDVDIAIEAAQREQPALPIYLLSNSAGGQEIIEPGDGTYSSTEPDRP